MINELDAIDEAEAILADHWTYSVLPAERRAIRVSQRLETMYAQAQGQFVVTWADVVIVLLGALLMVVIGMRL